MAGNSKISQLSGAKRNGATPSAEPEEEELGIGAETNEDDYSVAEHTVAGYGAYTADTPQSTTYDDVMAMLAAPLDMSITKQRDGYGTENGSRKKLTYLEWHTTVRQLNRIFGFGNWSTEVKEVTPTASVEAETGIPWGVHSIVSLIVEFPKAPGAPYGNTASYTNNGFSPTNRKKIYANGKWTGKYELMTWDAYEMAVKGAVHDALKRAATALGEQFGLSLYVKEEEGKQSRVADTTTASESSPTTTTTTSSTAATPATVYACEECGKEIRGYESKGGRKYTTEELVHYSQKDCDGHIFCYDHKQEWRDAHS